MSENPGESNRPRLLSDVQIGGLVAQTGCLALALVAGSVAGGITLDRLLNTRPMFTLLITLGGAPLTLYLLYRFAMRVARNAPPGPPAGRKGSHDDDE